MEHSAILETEPWGLSLNEVLLPEYLAALGYARHMVGKWHLGFFRKEYTPTFRGFQTYFGHWTGRHDYYTHFAEKYIVSTVVCFQQFMLLTDLVSRKY
jgi:arylsulfatase A-like enzyme